MNVRNAALIIAASLASLPLCAQDATPTPAPASSPAAMEAPAADAPAPAAPDAPADSASGTGTMMEAPPLTTEPLFPDPLPEGSIPKTGTTDSPELIPDFEPAALSTPPPGVRASKTSKEALELTRRIKLRKAKTKAESDPAVHAHWEEAEAAKTDPEKRLALRDFYNARANRMLKIDSSLNAEIEENRKMNLGELEQNKVRTGDGAPASDER